MANVPDEGSEQARRWGPRVLSGALAGLIASIPMALAMMGLNRLRSITRPTLPPQQVTARLTTRLSGLVGAKRGIFGKTPA